jgi:type III pantothenate kinase
MLCAVDVGNTAVKVAWFEGETLVREERREGLGSQVFSAWLKAELEATRSRALVVACVVPAWREAVRTSAGALPLRFAGEADLRTATAPAAGVVGLGADRWMAAEAAFAGSGPALAIAAGTATTFTVVDDRGAIRGVAIAPGLGLGADALARAGAQLFAVPLEVPAHVLGSDTAAALQSGLLHGHAALIDGLRDRLEREWGAPLRAVGTGGWMQRLQPLLARPLEVDPHLVLRGLAHAGRLTFS